MQTKVNIKFSNKQCILAKHSQNKIRAAESGPLKTRYRQAFRTLTSTEIKMNIIDESKLTPQSITSESSTVNMMQHIKMRAIGKMARESL